MRVLRIFATGLPLCVCALAHAVYAPIPDLEKGKDITLSLEGGITYNTNIFGAASGAIGSMDYSLAPKIAFNSSLTDQTFFTADYQPTLDYFDNRPGSKAVYSQAVDARLAHAFSKTSALTLAKARCNPPRPRPTSWWFMASDSTT